MREGQGWLIGEVARLSGVAAKTLRYYIGLIEPTLRDGSGYRDFDGSVQGRLAFIRNGSQILGAFVVGRVAAAEEGGCRESGDEEEAGDRRRL